MSYSPLKKHHIIHHKIKKISSNEYLRVLILRTLGNFLILSSLFLTFKTFYFPVREEIRYFIEKKINKKYVIKSQILNVKPQNQIKEQKENNQHILASIIKFNQTEVLTPVDPNFTIIIPKIGANAKIISNVNAGDERIYLPILQKGVAHAEGTAFPGEGGHIFLFAHSTDYFWNVGYYNAIFYLLYKLEEGDEVNLIYKGQRYVYKVIGKEIVNPSQVEYLTRKSNREFLTLQTCWPPGTTLQRLLIFAVRAAE